MFSAMKVVVGGCVLATYYKSGERRRDDDNDRG